MEAAGVIEAVAPDVAGLVPGMRVAYIGMGAYAEFTRIRASRVIPIPDTTTFEQAAAFPIAVLTAWHLIHSCHNTSANQIVLVHSAAGGVGIAAVQIARAAGAQVIGTVSSDDKADLVRKFGAQEVINYATHDFAAETMRITNGRGVDLILDAVGKPTFEKGLACLAPFGHLILYGSAGGAPEPIDIRRHLMRSRSKSAASSSRWCMRCARYIAAASMRFSNSRARVALQFRLAKPSRWPRPRKRCASCNRAARPASSC